MIPGVWHGFGLEQSLTQPDANFDGEARAVTNHDYVFELTPEIPLEAWTFQSEYNAAADLWTDVFRLQISGLSFPTPVHLRVRYGPGKTVFHGDAVVVSGNWNVFTLEPSSPQTRRPSPRSPCSAGGVIPVTHHSYRLQLYPDEPTIDRQFVSRYDETEDRWQDVLGLRVEEGEDPMPVHILVTYDPKARRQAGSLEGPGGAPWQPGPGPTCIWF